MKNKEIRYFNSFNDDFITSKNQNYKLPEDYNWIKKDFFSKLFSKIIYAVAIIISFFYCKLFLHISFKNSSILRKHCNGGMFLIGNHTQPVGDVFIPALAAFPNRIYTIISPSNFGIPFIGKLLPFLGALPVADNLSGMKKFNDAIKYRLDKNKCIVIYPEAHVWEYYNKIRPFSTTSFKFPVKFNSPVFTMTTTYKKRKFGVKPKAVIYIDGPFYANIDLPPKLQAEDLKNQVEKIMFTRSEKSNYSYIKYVKK